MAGQGSLTISLSPKLSQVERLRVVLNWGDKPNDLDLGAQEKSSNSTFDPTICDVSAK